MKNKLITYIMLAYFIVLTSVLIFQLPNKNDTPEEPIASTLKASEKLTNSSVVYINSPFTIINESHTIIDKSDPSITPLISGGRVYLPVRFIEKAFNANVSFIGHTGELSIRFDNKAILLNKNSTTAKIVDNTSEQKVEIPSPLKIIDDRSYIELKSFGILFDKEIFYNEKLIILSEFKNIFDVIEDADTLNDLIKSLSSLPKLQNQEKLNELINQNKNSNSYYSTENIDYKNINSIFEMIFVNQGINPESLTDGLEIDFNKLYDLKASLFQGDFKKFIETSFKKTSTGIFFLNSPNKVIHLFKENFKNNSLDYKIFNINLDDGFNPIEFYVIENTLIVMGNKEEINGDEKNTFSSAYIYDLSNLENINLYRQINIEGQYFSHSFFGQTLYLVSKTNNVNSSKNKSVKTPLFFDSQYMSSKENINFDNTFFLPDMVDQNFTTVTSIPLSDRSSINTSYLGAGNNILFEENSMYMWTYSKDFDRSIVYKSEFTNGIPVFQDSFDINGDIVKIAENHGGNTMTLVTKYTSPYKYNVFIVDSNFNTIGKLTNLSIPDYLTTIEIDSSRLYFYDQNSSEILIISIQDVLSPKYIGRVTLPGDNVYVSIIKEDKILCVRNSADNKPDNTKKLNTTISIIDISDLLNMSTLKSTSVENTKDIILEKGMTFIDKNILYLWPTVSDLDGRSNPIIIVNIENDLDIIVKKSFDKLKLPINIK